jgi:hypothetical protein
LVQSPFAEKVWIDAPVATAAQLVESADGSVVPAPFVMRTNRPYVAGDIRTLPIT